LVELTLQSQIADEVSVTNDKTCATGGVWEPLLPTRNWTLARKYQEAAVYAKVRNLPEGVESRCLSAQIIHDDEAPAISLEKPAVITNVPAPIFNFIAGDTLSGLKRTTCEWPGQPPVECSFASSNGNVSEGRFLVKVM